MPRFTFAEKLNTDQKISIAQIQIGHAQEDSVLFKFNLSLQLNEGIALEHYGSAAETNLFLIMLMPAQESVSPGLIILSNYTDTLFQAFSLGCELEEKDYALLATFLSQHTQNKKLVKRLSSYAKGVMFCTDILVEKVVSIYIRNGINAEAMQALASGLESVTVTSERDLKQVRHELVRAKDQEAALLQEMGGLQDTVLRLEKEKKVLLKQLQQEKHLSQQSIGQPKEVLQQGSEQIIERQQQELMQARQMLDLLREELAQKQQSEDDLYAKLEQLQQEQQELTMQCDQLWELLAEERQKCDRLQTLEQERLVLEERCRGLMENLSHQQQLFTERLSQHEDAQHEFLNTSLADELAQCHVSAGDVLDQEQKMQFLQQLLKLCRELDYFCKLSQTQLVDVQLEKNNLQIERERIALTRDTLMKRSFIKRLTNKPVAVEDEALELKHQDLAAKRQAYAEQAITLSTQYSDCAVSLLEVLSDFNVQMEVESSRYNGMIDQFSDLIAAQIIQIQRILAELYPKYSGVSRSLKCFFLLNALHAFQQVHPSLITVLATLTEHFAYNADALEVEGHAIPSDTFMEKLSMLKSIVEKINPVIQAASVNPANGVQPVMLTYMQDLRQIMTDLSWYRRYAGLREGILETYESEVTRYLQEAQVFVSEQEHQHLSKHVGDKAHATTVASVGKTAQSMMVGNQLAGEEHAISPQILAYTQFCKLLLCWHVMLIDQVSGSGLPDEFDLEATNEVIDLFVRSRRPLLKEIYHEHHIDLAAEMHAHTTVIDIDDFQEKMQRATVLKQALPGAFAQAFDYQFVRPLFSSIRESIDAVGVFARFPSLLQAQLKALCSENSFA